ncbi:uncharacterized protein LOC131402212 isoform X5 [Diceros bicornis minor]|uniref:uncharacterized protein LOC131402212 isoform X5 n=1 Tax=Diceros bicornis minor TaxID=77932 RepID=UPI0026F2B4C9|nr:uncharacterized protein LOC131402212 isoform X5 [Diceros bicornis minor]
MPSRCPPPAVPIVSSEARACAGPALRAAEGPASWRAACRVHRRQGPWCGGGSCAGLCGGIGGFWILPPGFSALWISPFCSVEERWAGGGAEVTGHCRPVNHPGGPARGRQHSVLGASGPVQKAPHKGLKNVLSSC